MTVKELSARTGFRLLTAPEEDRAVTGVYCGDLLSFVMGRAPADCAWVTVMGNVNAIAVAVLADTACIVLSEGVEPDADALEKAAGQQVALLQSALPTFETALALHEALK